ncbi:hypothetical protein M5X00_26365 [Paenibacillus alvei]|uniref:hypothetical protein n=1 Tax=Paenibacillus alvei TaxID=44250 RepID=UPI00228245E9|nr:hypothetical protein [Paenibacillus alvei]MCY9757757.1 hypothetical protein [Paenibacillus alvei]
MDFQQMSNTELVDKLVELAENKDSSPSSEAYEYCIEQIADIKAEILSRMSK